MNKVIDLRMNVKEVLVTLLIYGLFILFAFISAERFDRLGLNTNYISNDNVVEFVLR